MPNNIPLRDRFFEIIDNNLFVFEKAMEQSGLSVSYYRKEKSEGNNRLQFLDHPHDRRYNLVAFETMSDTHKDKIKKIFPNPYDHVVRQPIMNLLSHDNAAEQYFLAYRYDEDGKALPIKKVKQYTRSAMWLNLLNKVDESKNKIIKELGITVPDFYNHVKDLMEIEKRKGNDEKYIGLDQLPTQWATAYDNLRKKLKMYLHLGFSCLITKHLGNKRAGKIINEKAEAQLLNLLSDPRQFDDVAVCMFYNQWAKDNGEKKLHPRTICNWRQKKQSEIIMSREGNGAYNEKFIREIKGLLPSTPLALVEHDDNNLDFLFHNDIDDKVSKYVAICVFDSRTKLLLGKSYTVGKSPEQWQVYHAYLDAMYYIRSITGGWHLPFEIKADKWASASLTPFYNSIAKFIPPAHGNKHRGYIEQYFGTKLWKRCQQLISQGNYSGNNITAKNAGVNRELLAFNQQKKNLPLISNASDLQIENFFHLLRNMPDFKREDMNAPSKQEQFLTEWNQLKDEDKRPINDEQFLTRFGIKHEPTGRSIIINNRGIEPQINGCKYSYDLPESWMYDKLIGAQVNIVYDPFDMSRVLVINDDDIRFVANTAQLAPRALKDQIPGSRTYLNALLAEKKEQVQLNSKRTAERKKIYDSSYATAEAVLQSGTLIKEIKNEAEHKMIEQFTTDHEKYMDDNINFNEYL